jgi:hypothetical protein
MAPRVMMKGCTRRATMSPPFKRPQSRDVPRQVADAEQDAENRRVEPHRRP